MTMNVENSSATLDATVSSGQAVAASLGTLVYALVGATGNGLAFGLTLKLKSLKEPFCRIFIVLNATNLLILLIYIVWIPTVIIANAQASPWYLSLVTDDAYIHELFPGIFFVTFFTASLHLTILLALNRFIAIWWPHDFLDIFSDRRVLIYIAVACGLAVLIGTPPLIPSCGLFYDPDQFAWISVPSACITPVWYANFALEVIYIIAVIALNSATFWKLRQRKKKSVVKKRNAPVDDAEARSNEVAFIAQASLSGFTMVVCLVIFYVVGGMVEGVGAQFFCRTICGILPQTIDGYSYVFFNRNIRHFLRGLFRRNAVEPSGGQGSTVSKINQSRNRTVTTS